MTVFAKIGQGLLGALATVSQQTFDNWAVRSVDNTALGRSD